MKKLTKRIMALMLSLAMILGCIPCFNNVANAIDLKMIQEILQTVDGSFPTTEIGAWENGKGSIVYGSAPLRFFTDGTLQKQYNHSAEFKLNGSTYESTDHPELLFHMTDNKLTSIEILGEGAIAGIYTAPSIINLTINTDLTDLEKVVKFKTENDYNLYLSKKENSSTTINVYEGFLFPYINTILFTVSYSDKIDSVDKVYFNGTCLEKANSDSKQIANTKNGIPFYYTYEDVSAFEYVIVIPLDFGRTFSFDIDINEELTPGDLVLTNIPDSINERMIRIDVYEKDSGRKLAEYEKFEKGKPYIFEVVFGLELSPCKIGKLYKEVTVNGTKSTADNGQIINNDHDETIVVYEYGIPAPSSGSKKYKATNTNDSAEKITGSGKKGSTRTIVPEEGRKVSSVLVTDKEGNKIDVTMNADGTYSFVQPAENVNVEVTYINREITLNIGSIEAAVDGEKSNLDVAPIVRNDRTMLPIRFVAENLGAKVEWSEKNPNYVAITRGDTKIEITLGSDIMKVNNKDVKLDSVAFAENDRTYLPVRAISEALNAVVEWNENEPSVVKIFER
ncbi:MAG: copper amine oxidase N-terminal domain-containing protein [Clostridia bacterium]|nr:copper amine oxidase N-terminal domain-containing protein [Clostridia bacterium]